MRSNEITGGVTGTLMVASRPCEQEPCIPGLAMAVAANKGIIYFLLRAGEFYMSDGSLSKTLPPIGSIVTVSGRAAAKQDHVGDEFFTIEVSELYLVQPDQKIRGGRASDSYQ